jgi:hypothetical protein
MTTAKHAWKIGASMQRDLRLDFFRGLSLWMIFLDHIPSHAVSDVASWITVRNYGFSDAAEIFVVISGYTASLVYGRKMSEQGFVVGSARILHRVWQIYVAHLFLFVFYVAEVGYAASGFDAPNFENYANVFIFFQHPDTAIVQALLLRFKPVDLDVLPVYILLLTVFPPVLWLLRRAPQLVLAGSAILYGCVWLFGWNLSAYPDGLWYFNPFAWQFIFVLGAWCAAGGGERLRGVADSRLACVIAAVYLVVAFFIAMTWHSHFFAAMEPSWLARWFVTHSIDKTNLHPLRLVHFLALALIALRFVPRESTIWQAPIFRQAILCGQHSLEIFCAGVFLSFASHVILFEWVPGDAAQIVVSASGITLMIALAGLMTWYQAMEMPSRESAAKRIGAGSSRMVAGSAAR